MQGKSMYACTHDQGLVETQFEIRKYGNKLRMELNGCYRMKFILMHLSMLCPTTPHLDNVGE